MRLVTDDLGFKLAVDIRFSDCEGGRHSTYETTEGVVPGDAPHVIEISNALRGAELVEVVAHEVYHLFYAVRGLISVDEEAEVEVFGQLVSKVFSMAEGGE